MIELIKVELYIAHSGDELVGPFASVTGGIDAAGVPYVVAVKLVPSMFMTKTDGTPATTDPGELARIAAAETATDAASATATATPT